MSIQPRVLILSNRHDYSADYVVARLHDRQIPYLRLNSDEYASMELTLFPVERRLVGQKDGIEFVISADRLRSVYFRCPVFLRETTTKAYDFAQQLSVGQWSSFTRSLMLFDRALWVNHPQATYVAETKPVQLATAHKVGFAVPTTVVTNSLQYVDAVSSGDPDVIVKGVDTVLLRDQGKEAFSYSNLLNVGTLRNANLSSAPAIVQRSLHRKIDLRVTVVAGKVFPVRIVRAGRGIEGDWRRHKDSVSYEPVQLPLSVVNACRTLVQKLGLVFGAIDLAEVDGEFFFIEINPTGEWAWLTAQLDLPIDVALADVLSDHAHWW